MLKHTSLIEFQSSFLGVTLFLLLSILRRLHPIKVNGHFQKTIFDQSIKIYRKPTAHLLSYFESGKKNIRWRQTRSAVYGIYLIFSQIPAIRSVESNIY